MGDVNLDVKEDGRAGRTLTLPLICHLKVQEALNSCQNHLKERKGQAEDEGKAVSSSLAAPWLFQWDLFISASKEESSLLVLSSWCGRGEKTLGSHAGSESPLGYWEKMNSVLYSASLCLVLSILIPSRSVPVAQAGTV